MNPPHVEGERRADHSLKVTGEGVRTAAPDRAILTLGFVTEDSNPDTAQKTSAETVSNMISAILALAILPEQIKTEDYRIDILYDYIEGKQVFRGYQVTHLLQITTSMEQAGQVLDTAVKNGANTVSNVRFSLSNSEAFYNEALAAAYKDAEQKALALAATAGITLNKVPVSIQEISSVSGPVPFQAQFAVKSSAPPLQPGELTITATVNVEYGYV
ncbi:uncharacterized protein YggE [Bacillus ectoiniformans]|uniref:SIMPL domain-containing protein n=1 Tax=Bacillus ectoiniformans TaxID=1494429 RepID=UPI00195BCF21|nr:SIMPL domain-containing protein [Bacillus ectoiniformans]MBM7648277.1 uncharacterized protein YggE [Bacillus ectoiniformans]